MGHIQNVQCWGTGLKNTALQQKLEIKDLKACLAAENTYFGQHCKCVRLEVDFLQSDPTAVFDGEVTWPSISEV